MSMHLCRNDLPLSNPFPVFVTWALLHYLLYETQLNKLSGQGKYKLFSFLFIFDTMMQYCFLLQELLLYSFSKNFSHLG